MRDRREGEARLSATVQGDGTRSVLAVKRSVADGCDRTGSDRRSGDNTSRLGDRSAFIEDHDYDLVSVGQHEAPPPFVDLADSALCFDDGVGGPRVLAQHGAVSKAHPIQDETGQCECDDYDYDGPYELSHDLQQPARTST